MWFLDIFKNLHDVNPQSVDASKVLMLQVLVKLRYFSKLIIQEEEGANLQRLRCYAYNPWENQGSRHLVIVKLALTEYRLVLHYHNTCWMKMMENKIFVHVNMALRKIQLTV